MMAYLMRLDLRCVFMFRCDTQLQCFRTKYSDASHAALKSTIII